MKIDQNCFNTELGNYLKTLRLSKNLTIVELSILSGINKDTISNYERGKHQISYLKLLIIRELFGLKAEECFQLAQNILNKCKIP